MCVKKSCIFTSEIRVRLAPSYMFKPSSNLLTDHSKEVLFYGDPFLLFVFYVCHAILSVPCSLVVTCWESDDLLTLLYLSHCPICCPGSGVVFDCIDS